VHLGSARKMDAQAVRQKAAKDDQELCIMFLLVGFGLLLGIIRFVLIFFRWAK
jgi:hypothetical protein